MKIWLIIFCFNLGLFIPLLKWSGIYVGSWIGLVLAAACALVMSLSAIVYGIFGLCGNNGGFYLTIAWLSAESIITHWPFGGFPWAAIAYTQINSPIKHFIPIGGTFLTGFVTIFIATILGDFIVHTSNRIAISLIVFLLILLSTSKIFDYLYSNKANQILNVALVQGNVPRLGLDFNAQRKAVLSNHIAMTEKLLQDIKTHKRKKPDLIFWPENSVDVDPFINVDVYQNLNLLVKKLDIPLVFGTLIHKHLTNQAEKIFNAVVLWDTVKKPTVIYYKKHLQPFGEYLPFPSLFNKISNKSKLVGNFTPGNLANDIKITLRLRENIKFGVATCYEILFPELVITPVQKGSTFLYFPANNATFGFSDENYQQLALAKFRAIETKRYTLVPTTSGISSIIDSEGKELAVAPIFKPQILQSDIKLLQHTTVAVKLGVFWEKLLLILCSYSLVNSGLIMGLDLFRRRK